jgi:drug/metabolite transporter (DMT)-like permease
VQRSAARARPTEATATLLAASAVVIWGITPRMLAVAERHSEPLMVTALRMAPAALLLLLALPVLRARIPGRALWQSMALTGAMIAFFNFGLTEGVARTGPGTAIVLSSTIPFFIALLSRVLLGERITVATGCGLVVGFVGVVLIVSSELGGGERGGGFALGLLLALAAAVAGAGSTMLVRKAVVERPDLDIVGYTTGQTLVAGTLLLVLAFAIPGTGGIGWSSSELWGAVAFVAVFGTVVATLAYFASLKRLTATRVGSWLFFSPVVAVMIEIVLGEIPAPLVFAGMALTVGGIAIVNAPPRAEASPALSDG